MLHVPLQWIHMAYKRHVIAGNLNSFECHYLVVCFSALTLWQPVRSLKSKKQDKNFSFLEEKFQIYQKMETKGESETKDTQEPVR